MNEPSVASQLSELPAPYREKRIQRNPKITPDLVEKLTDLVVQQLTETEACQILGIKPETWFTWKCRRNNESKYVELLSRHRAQFIKSRMDTIQRAEVKDWRAADRLLQITAPERFGVKQQTGPVLIAAVDNNVLSTALSRVFDTRQPEKRLEQPTTPPSVKPLPAPAIDV